MRHRVISFALTLSLLGAAGCSHHPHRSHVGVSESEAIFVVGEGEATARPDRIRLNLGVLAKHESLETAMQESVSKMNALREALLKLGVIEADMKTGNFSIGQVKEPVLVTITEPAGVAVAPAPQGKGKEASKAAPAMAPSVVTRTEERWVEQYHVSNTLEVVYPDLKRAGALITAAVQAGANNSWGLSFEVSDPKPMEATARAAALADAKKRAAEIAEATGVTLGRVLSVSDGAVPGPMPMANGFGAKAMSMESMPVEGGTSRLTTTVRVVYAIER